jgi:hypothetical protein
VVRKNEILDLLNIVWVEREEQLGLQSTLVENQERHQEAREALEEMLSWKDMCKSPPTMFLVYSKGENLRCHMLFET